MNLAFKKAQKKSKDKLIKMMGGYTKNEYKALESKYEKLFYDKLTSDKKSFIENEAIYKILCEIEDFMKSLYGIKPVEKWASKVFNFIRNNKYNLLVFGLHTKQIQNRYVMDTSLTHRDDGLKQRFPNDDLEDLFVIENDND